MIVHLLLVLLAAILLLLLDNAQQFCCRRSLCFGPVADITTTRTLLQNGCILDFET